MATEMSLRVGRRIRQRREELGIRTQRELADLIPVASVTNQTVNKWEQGVNEPSARYKALLAEALRVDVAYFIAEDEKRATPDPFPPASIDDRLDRMERRLMDLLEQQNDLLARQSEILEKIEAAMDEETVTGRVDAAVAQVVRERGGTALEAAPPQREAAPTRTVRSGSRRASKPDPA